ncbi:MAG: hypothetical protein ACI8P9_001862 [Parasphingorhabdus sp.]|jgi:hypothetical protein
MPRLKSALCNALYLALLCTIFVGASTAAASTVGKMYPLSEDFADDGVPLTQTFFIKSVAASKYLYQTGYGAALYDLLPDDARFEWVFRDSLIINVKTGLHLAPRELEESTTPYIADLTLSARNPAYSGKWTLLNSESCTARGVSSCEPAGGYYDREMWSFQDLAKTSTTHYKLKHYHPNVEDYKCIREKTREAMKRNEWHLLQQCKRIPNEKSTVLSSNTPIRAVENPKNTDGSARWSNRSIQWQIVAAKKRDLALVTIEKVTAIQTSKGTDGATDVMFKGFEVTAEWGPTVLASPVGLAAKNAAKAIAKAGANAAKKGATAAKGAGTAVLKKLAKKQTAEQVTTRSFKDTIKDISKQVAATQKDDSIKAAVTAKEAAKKAAIKAREAIKKAAKSGSAAAIKAAKEAAILAKKAHALAKKYTNKLLKFALKEAREYIPKQIKKLKDVLNTVRSIFSPYRSFPRMLSKWGKASKYAGNVNTVRNLVSKVYSVPRHIHTAGQAIDFIGTAGIAVARGTLKRLFPHHLAATTTAEAEEPSPSELDLFNAYLRARAAVSVLESDAYLEDAISCAKSDHYYPVTIPIRNVVTKASVSEVTAKTQELLGALNAAGEKKSYDAGMMVLDTILMNPDFLKNLFAPLIDDTPDDLIFKLQGRRLFRQKISKGRSIDLGNVVMIDRQVAMKIDLVEHDSRSDDDDMGSLTVNIANLRTIEQYESAIIYDKDEGSLYGVDFKFEPLGHGPSRQKLENIEYHKACKRQQALDQEIEHTLASLEQAKRIFAAIERSRAAVQDKFGEKGVKSFNNSRRWAKVLGDAGTCTGFDPTRIPGDWRIGGYDDQAQAVQDTTWSHRFFEDGTFVSANGDGIWRPGPPMYSDRQGDSNIFISDVENFIKYADEKVYKDEPYLRDLAGVKSILTNGMPGNLNHLRGLFRGNTIVWYSRLWTSFEGEVLEDAGSGDGQWKYAHKEVWYRQDKRQNPDSLSGNWTGPASAKYIIHAQDGILIYKSEQQDRCGIYLNYEKGQYFFAESKEQFLPIRTDAGAMFMYRYANHTHPWRNNFLQQVNEFAALDTNYRDPAERVIDKELGDDYQVISGDKLLPGKYDVKPKHIMPAGGGPGLWLEKLDNPDSKNHETANTIAAAKQDLIGVWEGRTAYAPSYWGKNWLFTEDEIVVGGPGTGSNGDPVIGSWRYLGDHRFAVKIDSPDPKAAEFTIYVGPGAKLDASNSRRLYFVLPQKPGLLEDGRQFYSRNVEAIKAIKKVSSIRYDLIASELKIFLAIARKAAASNTPATEQSQNSQTLDALRSALEEPFEPQRVAEVARLNTLLSPTAEQARAANKQLRETVKATLDQNAICSFTREYNDENILGRWRIGNYDQQAHKLKIPGLGGQWTFAQDGKLTGSIDGKPWSASWTALPATKANIGLPPWITQGQDVDDLLEVPKHVYTPYGEFCRVDIEFDQSTASYFEVAEKARVWLFFQKDGDKEFYITRAQTGENEELGMWGLQEVDKSQISYHFDQKVFPNIDTLVSHCAGPDLKPTSNLANEPIELRLFEKRKIRLDEDNWVYNEALSRNERIIKPALDEDGSVVYERIMRNGQRNYSDEGNQVYSVYKYDPENDRSTLLQPRADGSYTGVKGEHFVILKTNPEQLSKEGSSIPFQGSYSGIMWDKERYISDLERMRKEFTWWDYHYHEKFLGNPTKGHYKQTLLTRVFRESSIDLVKRLGQEYHCAGIVSTDKGVAHSRKEHNERLVSSVNFEPLLSEAQVANNCTTHPRISASSFDDNLRGVTQQYLTRDGMTWKSHNTGAWRRSAANILNVSMSPLFVYQVDNQRHYDYNILNASDKTPGAEHLGAYMDSKPILELNPGKVGQLMGRMGDMFTVLDENQNCVRVVEFDSIDTLHKTGILIGANSDPITPVDDPTYLSPKQIENGCLALDNAVSRMAGNVWRKPIPAATQDLPEAISFAYQDERPKVFASFRQGWRSVQQFGQPTRVKVTNTGTTTLQAYWNGYWNSKGFDVKQPTLTLEPGQTRELLDHGGSVYTVLSENGWQAPNERCTAVIKMADTKGPIKLNGDLEAYQSKADTPAVYSYVDSANTTNTPLNKAQVANGCKQFGRITSIPTLRTEYEINIANKGTTPLTINWLSFYGAPTNGESERKSDSYKLLQPGESHYIDVSLGDVYSVVDDTDACVGVTQSTDFDPARKSNPEDSNGRIIAKYYEFYDNKHWHRINRIRKEHDQKRNKISEEIADLDSTNKNLSCNNLDHHRLVELLRGWWKKDHFNFDYDSSSNATGGFTTSTETWQINAQGHVIDKWASAIYQIMPHADDHSCQFKLQDFRTTDLEFKIVSYVLNNDHIDTFYSKKTVTLSAEAEPGDFESFDIRVNRNLTPVGAMVDADDNANLVSEDAVAGDLVGLTLSATEQDTSDTITYSLENNAEDRFSVDPDSGVIRVVQGGQLLDRETHEHFTITAQAISGDGSKVTQQFEIVVGDVNEYPVGNITDLLIRNQSNITSEAFEQDEIVWEDAADGSPTGFTLNAKDYDSTAEVTLHLSDDAGGLFRIDNDGEVRVSGELDFETASSHSVEATASSDDGSIQTKRFVIEIRDRNEFDVTAVVDTDDRENSVDEDADIGTPIGITLFASDDDASNNAVTYSLDYNARSSINPYNNYSNKLFRVSDFGEITVSGELDFEQHAEFDLKVFAHSSDKSTSEATFTVTINNVNDVAISELVDTDHNAERVEENAEYGTTVGITAHATDEDALNNRVQYSITDGADNASIGAFDVDSDTGVVIIADSTLLDYETATTTTVTVQATSEDGSSSQQTFTIELIDADDNNVSVVIDIDDNENQASENTEIGSAVGITAIATDDDIAASVYYTLSNDAGGLFSIDPDTGVVTVAGYLDSEQSLSHSISITAIGIHSDENNATSYYSYPINQDPNQSYVYFNEGYYRGTESVPQELVIRVNPVNEFDIDHVRDSDNAADAIDEGAAPGTLVGVTAFAQDEDSTDTVTYQLIGDYNGMFSIDPESGVITFDGGELDYESLDWPSVTVEYIATSSDGSTSDWPQTATININDVNEFAISAIIDTDDNFDTVAEDATYGSTVGITAHASDEDGTNNSVFYQIVDMDDNENYDGAFGIDEDGVISIHSEGKLDYETDPNPILRVMASSEDGTRSFAEFVIELEDVFEKIRTVSPIIDTAPGDNTVRQGDYSEQTGITLFAEEEDAPDSEISYTIVDEYGNEIIDGPFWIYAGNEVRTRNTDLLDFENESSVIVTIRASTPDGITSQEQFVISLAKEILRWQDDPQDPRGDNDYSSIPDNEYNACEDANNYPDSTSYNNESAYYDCLDQLVSNNPGDDGEGGDGEPGTTELTPTQIENGCAVRGNALSKSSDYEALITITNTGDTTLNIFWINLEGAEVELDDLPYPENIIEAGAVNEFNTNRGYLFVVLDDYGSCAGVVQPRESRNSYSFGTE